MVKRNQLFRKVVMAKYAPFNKISTIDRVDDYGDDWGIHSI